MVAFLFYVHTITVAKQYAGLEPGRWIFQPGHLTWRALVWRSAASALKLARLTLNFTHDVQNGSRFIIFPENLTYTNNQSPLQFQPATPAHDRHRAVSL